MNSSDSFSTFGTEPRDGEVEGPSWLQRYETVKSHILHKAAAEQETLDPQVAFGALSEPQKARLCKALVRFFTMKQGLAPSLPIPREEAVRIFEAARREASMVPSQRLFPYFLIEARKKLVEIFGLDVVQVEKKIPSEDRKKKKNIKPTMVFYVVSLLPKEVTNQFMDAKESQLMGMIGFVIRLVIASDGKLEKSEAIDLLSNLGFREGVYHRVFGEWENAIFGEALKRRYLITSKADPNVFELGERVFLDMEEENIPQEFHHFGS